jgi:hypothetical protein
MSFISKIFSDTVTDAVSKVGDTIRKFVTTDKDRMAVQVEVEKIISDRMSKAQDSVMTELQAKAQVLQAELQQGDAFTKRARPTVVYCGLLMILYNHCIIPTIQTIMNQPVAPFTLPVEFWVAWGGIVGTWSIGRTVEKRGASLGDSKFGKIAKLITGA